MDATAAGATIGRSTVLLLHLRPRGGHCPSAAVHGPFATETDAAACSARLRRRTHAGDRMELVPTPAGFPATAAERQRRAEDLARRLLRRLEAIPGDFDPRRPDAALPPAGLFALARLEAPGEARTAAAVLAPNGDPDAVTSPALLGQVLLDVPHETGMLLHATRWPAAWSPAARQSPHASRLQPPDARTACAVLDWRLDRGHWPRPDQPAGLRRHRGPGR